VAARHKVVYTLLCKVRILNNVKKEKIIITNGYFGLRNEKEKTSVCLKTHQR
jgi:hypothetical protein